MQINILKKCSKLAFLFGYCLQHYYMKNQVNQYQNNYRIIKIIGEVK